MDDPPISPHEARALRRAFKPTGRWASLRIAIETTIVASAAGVYIVAPAAVHHAFSVAAIPSYVAMAAVAALALDAYSTIGARALTALIRTLYRRFHD